MQSAQHIFAGIGVQINSVGRPYLGAALGSISFKSAVRNHLLPKLVPHAVSDIEIDKMGVAFLSCVH